MSADSLAIANAVIEATEKALKQAEATLGGVGMACFFTMKEQEDAFAKAFAKRDAAKQLVNLATAFRDAHGDFS